MIWLVDTCIVIDVLESDLEFGHASALLLDKMASEGIALCPVSYVELVPAFLGGSGILETIESEIRIVVACEGDVNFTAAPTIFCRIRTS